MEPKSFGSILAASHGSCCLHFSCFCTAFTKKYAKGSMYTVPVVNYNYKQREKSTQTFTFILSNQLFYLSCFGFHVTSCNKRVKQYTTF